jgi:hypothetical protein
MNLFFDSCSHSFLTWIICCAFSITCLILLLTSSFLFVYAQLDNPGRPITSKVVPANSSATPSNAPFYKAIPATSKVVPANSSATPSNAPFYKAIPATSKVVPANSSTTPSRTSSSSYTVTNATITFFDNVIFGTNTKKFIVSIVNSSDTLIVGDVKNQLSHSVITPTIETIKGQEH